MMRVFVTGAHGRVGSALVTELVRAGHAVTGLVRGAEQAARVEALGAATVTGRLSDPAALEAGLVGAELVFHLAGGLRGAGADTAERINLEGTRSLIAALGATRSRRPPLRALVFTSTAAIYGDRSGLWVDETMMPYPQTAYGVSKLKAEKALFEAASSDAFPLRVARLAAVYGPGFPFLMADPIRAGKAWLPGEGRNYVSTIHVEDAVAGLLRLAQQDCPDGIYNLADPNPMTVAKFYAEVHRHVGGQPVRFWSTWVPSYVQQRLAARLEWISAALGRRPRVTPDALRLFTASSRLKVDRLDKELAFEWRFPDAVSGLAATFNRAEVPPRT